MRSCLLAFRNRIKRSYDIAWFDALHVLMHCPNESHFEVHIQKLYNNF